jgi:hypothetical protein
MRLHFSCKKHSNEKNDMLVVYAKMKKNWCCLEHIDLLLTTLRFVFFAQTTRLSFLEDFWHAIRIHVHVSCTKISELFFCFYLLFLFFIFIEGGAYELVSKKTIFVRSCLQNSE